MLQYDNRRRRIAVSGLVVVAYKYRTRTTREVERETCVATTAKNISAD